MTALSFNWLSPSDQPKPSQLATLLYPATDGMFPMVFDLDLPNGNLHRRRLLLATRHQRVTQNLLGRLANYGAAVLRTIYPDTDFPASLETSLLRILERQHEQGAPYREFSLFQFPSSGAWAYDAYNCGGTLGQEPLLAILP